MPNRTCSVDGCDKRRVYSNGLCPMHYQRVRKHGTTDLVRKPKTPGPCSVGGCEGKAGIPGTARGLCSKHYARWRTFGDPEASEPIPGWGQPCSVSECSKPSTARGLCAKHYMRWLTHGTTDLVAPWATAPDGQKWCPVCRSYKDKDAFNRNRANRDGLQAECRSCGKVRGAEWRRRNPGVTAAQTARRPRELANEQARRSARRRRAEGRMPKNDRRARIRQVESESFTPLEIAERDGWRCQICRKSIGKTFKWPDPRSLSIDHIIPIARGGNHTRVNVQAAHLRCNLKKKARGVDQLRLIG